MAFAVLAKKITKNSNLKATPIAKTMRQSRAKVLEGSKRGKSRLMVERTCNRVQLSVIGFHSVQIKIEITEILHFMIITLHHSLNSESSISNPHLFASVAVARRGSWITGEAWGSQWSVWDEVGPIESCAFELGLDNGRHVPASGQSVKECLNHTA